MHEDARKQLIDTVDFAQGELADLDKHRSLDFKIYSQDKDKRRLVERIIENISNAVIDIIKIIIGEKGLDMPDSYGGIMKKGAPFYNLTDIQVNHLVEVAKLRNILAHEYLDLKWEKIKAFIKDYQATIKIILDKTAALIDGDIKER